MLKLQSLPRDVLGEIIKMTDGRSRIRGLRQTSKLFNKHDENYMIEDEYIPLSLNRKNVRARKFKTTPKEWSQYVESNNKKISTHFPHANTLLFEINSDVECEYLDCVPIHIKTVEFIVRHVSDDSESDLNQKVNFLNLPQTVDKVTIDGDLIGIIGFPKTIRDVHIKQGMVDTLSDMMWQQMDEVNLDEEHDIEDDYGHTIQMPRKLKTFIFDGRLERVMLFNTIPEVLIVESLTNEEEWQEYWPDGIEQVIAQRMNREMEQWLTNEKGVRCIIETYKKSKTRHRKGFSGYLSQDDVD